MPMRKSPSPDHYTASEAMEVLGVTEGVFYNFIRNGDLKGVKLPGRKQSLYEKNTINMFAGRLKPFSQPEEDARLQVEIDWMDERDLPYILAFDYEMYGVEATVDISKMYSWWKKNPRMARMIFDKTDRRNIWGSISILPMEEKTILKVLSGEKSEHEITVNDILTYEPGGKYFGYVSAAAIKPEHRVHLRGLLEDLLGYWCNQYPDIQMVKLYATAWSDGGWYLVRHLFFSPRHDLAEDAFELDLRLKNPSRFIKNYQDCILHKEENDVK